MKLDNHIKELIAIGASVAANCQPCLEYHTSKAKEFGADDAEISDAIETGKLVRKGAAAKMDKFALNILRTEQTEINKDTGCGCSDN